MDVDSCYSPYFGIGFEAEFGRTRGDNCDNDCDNDCDNEKNKCDDDCDNDPLCHDCVNVRLAQWGIWLNLAYHLIDKKPIICKKPRSVLH